MNHLVLIGNLGSDVECKYTKNNNPVAQLSIATTENVKKGDEWVKQTEWHRCNIWGKRAESCANYLRKGDRVAIQGKVTYRSYEDKEGVKKYSTEIHVKDIEFLTNSTKKESTESNKPKDLNEIPF